MPKAFVTGATGFLGSHLVDLLLERGCEVSVLARKTSNLRWLDGKNVKIHLGDVHSAEEIARAVDGADFVFHSAALLKARHIEIYRRVNVEGTRVVMDACLAAPRRPGKVVLVSSIAAVGPAFCAERPVSDADQCHPVSLYGQSKMEGEALALSYNDRIPVAVVRPPVIYGPRDTQLLQAFKSARLGIKPRIGFEERMFNLAHVQDIAEGTILAAEKEASRGETFVLGDSKNYLWEEMLDLLMKSLGNKGVWVPVPLTVLYGAAAVVTGVSRLFGIDPVFSYEKAREMAFRYWGCDISKARQVLGYEPKVSLDQGLAGTARWYREIGWM